MNVTRPGGAASAPNRALTRRRFLQAATAAGAVAAGPSLLSACGSDDDAEPSSESGGGSSDDRVVRVWTVPANDADEEFLRSELTRFSDETDSLTVELQFFPGDQYANAMQLAFTGGRDAPDIFRQAAGQGLGLRGAFGRGWVHPLTDFITDEFTSRFPDWVYGSEQSSLMIDGEPYGIAFQDPAVQGTRVLYYNIEVLEQFGFTEPPGTWSDWREMGTKITRDGNRQVYGLPGTLHWPILQNLAGSEPYHEEGVPIGLHTGQPTMSEPSLVATIEMLQELHADDVFSPGWESWGSDELIQQMATGRLAMFTGPIHFATSLREANPDLNLGIARPPVPDGGRAGSRRPAEGILAFWMMSSSAANPEAAWQVLDFLGSVDHQRAAFQEAGRISIIPEVYEGIDVDEDTRKIREIADDVVRIAPDPAVKDHRAIEFYEDLVSEGPTPIPREIYFEAVTRGTDFKARAEQYDEDLADVIATQLANSELDDMSAFTFPDWDPLRNYGS